MQKFLLIFGFLLLYVTINAQELTLHSMQNIWNAGKTNPAILPKEKLVIALPSPYFSLHHSSIGIDDFLIENAEGGFTFDPNQLFENLDDSNSFNTDLSLNTLGVQYNFGKLSLGISHGVNFTSTIDYPKSMVGLITKGNAHYIGEEIDFAPSIDVLAYNNFSLNAGYRFPKFVDIGARINLLTGIGAINTEKSNATIYTDDDIYEIDITTDITFNSSSFVDYDSTFNLNFQTFSGEDLFTRNNGFSFDLGVNIRPIEKLNIALSVLDIGTINWNENLKTYNSNIDRKFEAVEIDFVSLILGDSLNIENNNEELSFDEIFQFKESAERFETKLPSKIYASANYAISDKIIATATYNAIVFNGETRSAFALGGNMRFNKFVSAGLMYVNRNEQHGLGANVLLQFGPVQFFMVSDDILTSFTPYKNSHSNLRLGMNLAFKNLKKQNVIEE